MKKNSKSILSGKGFYIALALSIAMVGACLLYTSTSYHRRYNCLCFKSSYEFFPRQVQAAFCGTEK